MAIDTKHEDLQSLRIDRSQRGDNSGEPPAWARRYILVGIAVIVLLGLFSLAYRAFSSRHSGSGSGARLGRNQRQ